MTVRPRITGGKALRLASSNADAVRGRELELEKFLSEHGVDICLLHEKHLESVRVLMFANYVCHRTDLPTPGGRHSDLCPPGIDHYSVPVSGLQYLEATAKHLVLATRQLKLVAA
jgi:hypothetical protein